MREQILERFPKEYDRYVEVFGGAGWVLFGRKPDSAMEVFNDYNSDLINLYRCVKDRTFELIRELNFLPLNTRDEFEILKKFMSNDEFTEDYMRKELEITQHYLNPPEFDEMKAILLEKATLYDVRRAAAFYKLIRYSYGSGCTSFGCQPFDIRNTFGLIWAASRRLQNTLIENKSYDPLIIQQDRPGTLFFLDPPYYETEDHYKVVFTKEDHIHLRDILKQIQGMFLLTYNDCEYTRELYKEFHIESVTRLNNLAQRYGAGCEFPEIIVSNYDTSERRRSLPVQMGLFDDNPNYFETA